MDVAEIMSVLQEYSALNTDQLQEETNMAEKTISKIEEGVRARKKILEILNEKQMELDEKLEQAKAESQDLDVDIIRIKTQTKKLNKNVIKMENLNSSSVKIDISENDKRKLAMNQGKLELSKDILKIFVTNDDKGMVLNPSELEFKPFKIKNNHSKTSSRDFIWNNLAHCTETQEIYKELFNE